MSVVVAGLVAGGVMFVLMLVPLSLTSRRRIKRRIESVLEPRPSAAVVAEAAGSGGLFERPFAATQARLGHTRVWRSVESLVERGDLPVRTVEALWATVAGSLALLALALLFGAPPVGAIVLVALVLVVARVLVGIRITRRLQRFEQQLPEVLGSIAGALRAGHGFTQALAAVAEESEDPTSHELGRVIVETRLGRPVDDALADLGRRMQSDDLDFVLTAVQIQRQVGGSVAGVFETVADTVRQRQQFVLKIRGLTSMGRASAGVLMAVPIGMGVLLSVLSPGYMNPLFDTATGRFLLLVAVGSMAIGSLWLRRIVAFKG